MLPIFTRVLATVGLAIHPDEICGRPSGRDIDVPASPPPAEEPKPKTTVIDWGVSRSLPGRRVEIESGVEWEVAEKGVAAARDTAAWDEFDERALVRWRDGDQEVRGTKSFNREQYETLKRLYEKNDQLTVPAIAGQVGFSISWVEKRIPAVRWAYEQRDIARARANPSPTV